MAHFGGKRLGDRWAALDVRLSGALVSLLFQLQFNLEHFSVSVEDAWLSVVLC